MNESYIERRFKIICERNGMRVFKMSTQYETGIPDRLVLFNGFAGFAEIKAPGEKQTKEQEAKMRKLERQGCFCRVIDNPNDVVGFVGSFFNHIQKKKSA